MLQRERVNDEFRGQKAKSPMTCKVLHVLLSQWFILVKQKIYFLVVVGISVIILGTFLFLWIYNSTA